MTDERTPAAQSREQIREFRRIVASAVGELRSSQVRDAYAAVSIEELMDQHIARLEDSDDPIHPSRKQRIDKVHDDLTNNIEALKATDPSEFRRRDPDTDANTDPDAEGDTTTTGTT